MLDINRTKRIRTVAAGVVVFCLIGAQSWVLDTLGYDLRVDLIDPDSFVVEVFSDKQACLPSQNMHGLLDELSSLSVQLTIHEERDGVIVSDPLEGLIIELQHVYGEDVCTAFDDLSQEQQLLYIEIEKLLLDLKGLDIKAHHFDTHSKKRAASIS